MIDNQGVPVIVPYRTVDEEESPVTMWLAKLMKEPGAAWIYRKLQRYTITLPEGLANQLHRLGALDVQAGMMVLLDSHYTLIWGIEMPESLLSAEKSVI